MLRVARDRWNAWTAPSGKTYVNLKCPGCGKDASLSEHTIGDDGTVQPSVVCPFGCPFHDFVVLDGWTRS